MKIHMNVEDRYVFKKGGYTTRMPKVYGNEVVIDVPKNSTKRQLRLTLKNIIRLIDPAIPSANRHHWHGRKGIYITLNVPAEEKESIFEFLRPFLATLTRQASGEIWHSTLGSLWHDTWGEKNIPHRIQLVYLAKDSGI